MIDTVLSWFAIGLLLFTSVGMLLTRNRHRILIYLAILLLGVFWLVLQHWPIAMATVKLITGWMAIAILGMTLNQNPVTNPQESSWPQGRFFRLVTSVIVIIITFSASQPLQRFLPGVSLPETTGGLLLIGMGLLHLGITGQSFRTIIALLTTLAGFEIIYAGVENSTLVAALLSTITLGLALVGAYLLTIDTGASSA